MSRTLQVFFNIKSQANSTLRVFFFLIEVWLIYNVVLVSSVQKMIQF